MMYGEDDDMSAAVDALKTIGGEMLKRRLKRRPQSQQESAAEYASPPNGEDIIETTEADAMLPEEAEVTVEMEVSEPKRTVLDSFAPTMKMPSRSGPEEGYAAFERMKKRRRMSEF